MKKFILTALSLATLMIGSISAVPLGSGSVVFAQAPEPNDCQMGLDENQCSITRYIILFTNALSAIFGVVAIGMMAYAGIRYSMAKDNPQATAAAKEKIRNVVIAIVAYVFLYAFIQYIVPGGLF